MSANSSTRVSPPASGRGEAVSDGADSVWRMEWIATGVAIIAAIFAGLSAWEARRSRLDARDSARSAATHESKALKLSERLTLAFEESNARERRQSERYETPFAIVQEYVKGGKRWRLALEGTETVQDVRIETDPHDSGFIMRPDPAPSTMKPGSVVLFDWWQGRRSPDFISIAIGWTRPNGDRHSARQELH